MHSLYKYVLATLLALLLLCCPPVDAVQQSVRVTGYLRCGLLPARSVTIRVVHDKPGLCMLCSHETIRSYTGKKDDVIARGRSDEGGHFNLEVKAHHK